MYKTESTFPLINIFSSSTLTGAPGNIITEHILFGLVNQKYGLVLSHLPLLSAAIHIDLFATL